MSLEEEKKTTSVDIELTQALEFLRRYHPGFWDRVDERDIADILKLSHAMFITRPDLLEATTNLRYLPLQ